MMTIKTKQKKVKESGFTLLEILVSLLVLSIGLLGLAALQLSGMRNNQSAHQRSIAATQAYDIADRMRANSNTLSSYDNAAGTQDNDCITVTGCTAAEMAGHDIYEWNTDNAALLPSGTGWVCIDSTPNDGTPVATACDATGTNYAIKLWWDDDRSGAVDANDPRFVIVLRP